MTAPTDTTPTSPPPAETAESMGIDPYERNWIRLSLVLLFLFGGLITLAGFALGFQVPGEEVRVDPATVTDSGPFADPGLREIGEGRYEAYLVSRTFVFQPNELTIPVGSTIKFYVTSVDVQHGFKLQDTNVNMQVVPGQVSVLEATFDEIGEFPYICTEYCGLGHAAMFGTLRVVSPGQE